MLKFFSRPSRPLSGIQVFFALVGAALLVTLNGLPAKSFAAGSIAPGDVCDRVAHRVASETGVPISVLQAITRTETGRRREGQTQPWPWTVNMEGVGKWFDDPDEALAYVNEHFAGGARSFDVGCFQINYRWHGQHFNSIEDMFDPLVNARYAARFLRELFVEKGNWGDAAGAYHSRTPEYANRYKRRFQSFRTALGEGIPPSDAPPPVQQAAQAQVAVVRVNHFPLLQTGNAPRSHGSLVSLNSSGNGQSLFGREN